MPNRYKYCIVPMCTNSTSKAPNKVFFDVPRNKTDRQRWCFAMKRLSETSVRNVCQDHFDLENDTENFFQHQLQGAKLKLKKGVLPHVFTCQKYQPPAKSTIRAAKRQRKEAVADMLKNCPQVLSNDASTSDDGCNSDVPADDNKCPAEDLERHGDKGCQVKPTYRSKSTCTNIIQVDFGCTACPNVLDKACQTMPEVQQHSINEEQCRIDATDSDVCNESSDFSCNESPGSDYEPEEDDRAEKLLLRSCMMKAIRKKSFMCLGIPDEKQFLIEFLSKHSNSSELNIIITLKKIRMNETYENLAMLFGMSLNNVARIFQETLHKVAGVLQNFIIWPSDTKSLKLSLPIAFRRNFFNVQSIIDCFEIPIEKPSNAVNQSLTWSEYYKSNTLKYLVSCTPDGTVNFISQGYGGRTTDAAIVEDSGYLQMLFPQLDVMADRGFKNISHLLQQRQCNLIRPPSVSQNEAMSAEEVQLTKQIAAVRIHVERVISRLRIFAILSKHTCVDNHLLQLFDKILIVVCGLINFQNKLIKI
ncbi:uncharacterized protein LOC129225127 [Uloborus diversus]|uniref:uncharacterized protein LOC129225127 n=1 Tax=Uloborus diversus TaxID=327109 RepID=UPI00240A9140|nr:uncharacterized protein LOC129225127 [Uloborus diversus]